MTLTAPGSAQADSSAGGPVPPSPAKGLVCRNCGRTVEVEGPAVERWADKVAAEHGYADISHTLEIFGTCQDCQPT